MDTDLRASLVAAGAAAALSALVGLIAGVGALVLLSRALAGGVLFGALVYGGILAARRFLPGIGVEPGMSQVEEGETGRMVDIVLPGELPSAEGRFEGSELSRAARAGGDKAFAAEDMGNDDIASLLEPEIDLEHSSGHSHPAIPVPAQSGAASSTGVAQGSDELDLLPDLDGFADTFTAPEYGGESVSRPQPSPSGSRAGSSEGMDPATLAQAVRTILKRDQKG